MNTIVSWNYYLLDNLYQNSFIIPMELSELTFGFQKFENWTSTKYALKIFKINSL